MYLLGADIRAGPDSRSGVAGVSWRLASTLHLTGRQHQRLLPAWRNIGRMPSKGTDPLPRLGLRLRRRGQRGRVLHLLPVPQDCGGLRPWASVSRSRVGGVHVAARLLAGPGQRPAPCPPGRRRCRSRTRRPGRPRLFTIMYVGAFNKGGSLATLRIPAHPSGPHRPPEAPAGQANGGTRLE